MSEADQKKIVVVISLHTFLQIRSCDLFFLGADVTDPNFSFWQSAGNVCNLELYIRDLLSGSSREVLLSDLTTEVEFCDRPSGKN